MATTRIISSKQPNKNKGGVVFYGNPGGLGANGLDRSFIGVGLEYAGFHNARMNDIFQQPSTPTR